MGRNADIAESGADLPWSDSKRGKALERIGSLARLLRAIGAHGLVAVLDEAETIDQLWNRLSRMGAYETLGTFCSQPASMFVFGITKRFEAQMTRDIENGRMLCAPTRGAAHFMTEWEAGKFEIAEPPNIDLSAARKLVGLVLDRYSAAYPTTSEGAAAVEAAITAWQRNPSRNPRRLVRALIDGLDARRALVAPP